MGRKAEGPVAGVSYYLAASKARVLGYGRQCTAGQKICFFLGLGPFNSFGLVPGTDFQEHNEFIAEVLKGLLENGVPAEPVLFHYSDFLRWLNGRKITNENRSAYAGYLLAEAAHKGKSA